MEAEGIHLWPRGQTATPSSSTGSAGHLDRRERALSFGAAHQIDLELIRTLAEEVGDQHRFEMMGSVS